MGGRRRHFVALFDSIYHRGACIKQKPRPRHTARGCESILASLCAVQRKKKRCHTAIAMKPTGNIFKSPKELKLCGRISLKYFSGFARSAFLRNFSFCFVFSLVAFFSYSAESQIHSRAHTQLTHTIMLFVAGSCCESYSFHVSKIYINDTQASTTPM